ncbi:MAG: hypothetical protein QM817_40415 [Archangium sp.]
MLRSPVQNLKSMEEAGGALLHRAVDPSRWMLPGRRVTVDNRVRVGSVEVCATVDVTPTLETYLRVSFKGPRLSPMQAAELLEQFTSVKYTFIPNIEWFVEIDARQWIHFSRPYTQPRLQA